MRPLPEVEKAKRRGARRAKAILARDLGWLAGYPVDDGTLWVRAPAPGRAPAGAFVLTEGHVQRAARTLGALIRRFPRVMVRLVGDVERWSAAMQWRIAAAGARVRDEAPWPEPPVAGPWEDPAARALWWCLGIDDRAFRQTLEWTKVHAERLSRLRANVGDGPRGIHLSVWLARTAVEDGPERLDPWLRLLGGSHWNATLWVDEGWLAGVPREPKRWQPLRIGPVGLGALKTVLGSRRHSRRLALDLARSVLDLESLDGWRTWTEAADGLVQKRLQLTHEALAADELRRMRRRWLERWRDHLRDAPRPVQLGEMLDTIVTWAGVVRDPAVQVGIARRTAAEQLEASDGGDDPEASAHLGGLAVPAAAAPWRGRRAGRVRTVSPRGLE